jgi:DNA repair photolyase
MSLNVSRGNMYEFISHTWNTVKGRCYHNCLYCYMKRFGEQKSVRFDDKELKTDLGSGNFIFVGSSCDLFSANIPTIWIIDTLNHCLKYDNKYMFQSKNPGRMLAFSTYDPSFSSVLCTTIETNRHYKEIMSMSPSPQERVEALKDFKGELYITIEPIMDFDLDELVEMIKSLHPKQINIGADTGRNQLPEPSKEKILSLVAGLINHTSCNIKVNLERLLK